MILPFRVPFYPIFPYCTFIAFVALIAMTTLNLKLALIDLASGPSYICFQLA